MNDEIFRRLEEGDANAANELKAALSSRQLSQPEVSAAWKSLIGALASGKGAGNDLVSLGIRLSEASQNPESRDMYEKLFMLAGFPTSAAAHVAIIGVGANAVKINLGEVETKSLDSAWYVETARKCLVRAIHATEGAIKASASKGEDAGALEQNLIFIIEALRHLEGPEIKGELVAIVKNGFGQQVKDAAGESIAPMRIREEINSAKADLQFLLEREYPDPTTPQRMYIECIFSAVETVYSGKGRSMETEIAVQQLSAFGTRPGQIASLFEEHSLKLIGRNVENALLHALTSPEPKIRESAAAGLEKIGSDRIEGILERIVARCGEASQVGALASEALSVISGSKLELIEVKLPPPRQKPPPPPLLKGRITQ